MRDARPLARKRRSAARGEGGMEERGHRIATADVVGRPRLCPVPSNARGVAAVRLWPRPASAVVRRGGRGPLRHRDCQGLTRIPAPGETNTPADRRGHGQPRPPAIQQRGARRARARDGRGSAACTPQEGGGVWACRGALREARGAPPPLHPPGRLWRGACRRAPAAQGAARPRGRTALTACPI